MPANKIRQCRTKLSNAAVDKMHRFSHILETFLSNRQFVSQSSKFNSRFDLTHRRFHLSRALESNFRRSNGTGLVCLEKSSHDDGTKTSNNDEFSSDVEKAYRILRKFHSRVPKLELALNESGVELRPGLIERVLNRCGDAGNLGYRFFVWAAKRPGYYSHSHQVYRSMTKIISKMRRFGAVWSLIEEMRKENPHLIEPELFVVLARRFEGEEMVKKAVEVLDEMPEPDEYVFACLLDALCESGRVKDGAKLFEDMRLRFGPDRRYFGSLLGGWCREGRMMEAKHVLVQMKEVGFEPDAGDYASLVSGYANSGKMADGYEVLKDMRRRGFEPSGGCYAVLIQALCKVGRMEEAMSLFVEMERYECEADAVSYTELVSGFCKSGKIGKCYSLLDDMIKKGLVPSQVTYMHLMAAHEKRENLDECLELMERMKQTGYHHLDLDVYNVVIRLACKLGEVKEAVRLWNEMEANGLHPEVDTFVIMINGLTSQGCLLEACEHFKEMVSRGLFSVPQHVTLKSLLNCVLREEKLEMAEDVWSCIASKGTCELNVSLWTIWIHALFSKGYVKEACSYCVEMIEMDVMMRPDTFAKLMKGLKKLYNREFAVEITDKVRSMAAEREISFKMYKRRGVEDSSEKAKTRKDREGKKTFTHEFLSDLRSLDPNIVLIRNQKV
ncbi:putative pentatricopeptide repeat-containing protein [Hirschfeldia incana]|nr:putative pentatricopeptide repeat-containing protein [Hirschfeldia incana]